MMSELMIYIIYYILPLIVQLLLYKIKDIVFYKGQLM